MSNEIRETVENLAKNMCGGQSKLKLIIAHLRGLASGEIIPDDSAFGICSEISIQFSTGLLYDFDEKVYSVWPHWTGDNEFPVPHSNFSPLMGYNTENLWGNDRYGDTRRDLCEYLADYLFDYLADNTVKGLEL